MEITFETAMARIEEISKQLESQSVSLDDSIKLFEEGTKLADFCADCLKNAEQKITELKNQKAE